MARAKKIIFINGDLHTYNQLRKHAEAIAVEDGRIIDVGGNARMRLYAKRGFSIVDLRGQCVIPAITDAHLHLLNLGEHYNRVNLDGIDSLKKVTSILSKTASKLKKGQWLLGRGWNKNLWGEAFPDKSILDAITANPVSLASKDGHLLWINSTALKIFKMDEWSINPDGGVIEKDDKGEPTGILKENAVNIAERYIPELTFEERKEAILEAQKRLLTMGIIGVGECDTKLGLFSVYHDLDRTGQLRLRVFKMISPEKLQRTIDFKFKTRTGTEHLRTGCLKLFADGALGSQTALMFEPYDGSDDNYGVEATEPRQMGEYIKQAFGAGISVAIHAIGDKANYLALKAIGKYSHMARTHKLRPRIEHAQLLRRIDIRLFTDHDIIASVQPIHATSDRDIGERYWGTRAAYAYPFRAIELSRAALAFGSDAPIETANPIAGIHAAVTRSRAGERRRGWHPEQNLTTREAVQCYTMGSAYACCYDDITGSISVGKRADFVVLSENIFKSKPNDIINAQAVATVVDGQVEAGELG
jgi:predicted amidohydrolase YtcJ